MLFSFRDLASGSGSQTASSACAVATVAAGSGKSLCSSFSQCGLNRREAELTTLARPIDR